MASTGGTFRNGPGTSLCPKNHPSNALNVFQNPPSAAWLFLRNRHLGFSASVLLLSYVALPVLYLEVFLNGSNNRPSVMAPGRPSHRLTHQQPARASSMALISL